MNFYKNFTHALPVLLLSFFLILTGCNKNDDTDNSLPPATQTGEDIFACYVNGEKFIHRGTLNCFYQLIDGEYYFGINGIDKNFEPFGMGIGSTKKSISEGETYPLTIHTDGNFWAYIYYSDPFPTGSSSETDIQHTGKLTITKFDMENYIVSGTFWFDVQHPVTGERVEIREGRFDAQFGL